MIKISTLLNIPNQDFWANMIPNGITRNKFGVTFIATDSLTELNGLKIDGSTIHIALYELDKSFTSFSIYKMYDVVELVSFLIISDLDSTINYYSFCVHNTLENKLLINELANNIKMINGIKSTIKFVIENIDEFILETILHDIAIKKLIESTIRDN